MFPFLRFGFLSLCTGTFLKAYLSLSSHFPEAEEHLKLRLCKYCLKEFPPRLSLSPSEYFPRAEPLRSFTETFLSLHQENLLRFSRSTLRSGVLSLFTYILAPSVYFVNSFLKILFFIVYLEKILEIKCRMISSIKINFPCILGIAIIRSSIAFAQETIPIFLFPFFDSN